jgi:hypothetical protein
MGPTAPRLIFLKMPPLQRLHLGPRLHNLLKFNRSYLSRFLGHRHFVFWGPSEGPIVLEPPDTRLRWMNRWRAHVDRISYSWGGVNLNPPNPEIGFPSCILRTGEGERGHLLEQASNITSLLNFGICFIYSTLDLHTKTTTRDGLLIIIHNHSNKVSVHNIYLLVGVTGIWTAAHVMKERKRRRVRDRVQLSVL